MTNFHISLISLFFSLFGSSIMAVSVIVLQPLGCIIGLMVCLLAKSFGES